MSLTEEENTRNALRNGDAQAFDAVFRQLYAPLCRYAQRMTEGDPDEAEEIVQQVFVKLWEQREQLEIKWTLKSYLYKMVHNRSLNWRRDALSRQKRLAPEMALQETEAPGADDMEQRELQKAVLDALGRLPEQCRKIFELSRFEDLKYREIADHLNISPKTVEAQMGKALRLMRTYLSDLMLLWLATALLFIQNTGIPWQIG